MLISISGDLKEKLQMYLYDLIVSENKDKPELDDEYSDALFDECYEQIGHIDEIKI